MPVVIKLKFPAGRYHATPWGRHVNEGVAEWPPAPWRLLRALVAVWKRTCPTIAEEQVKRILTALVYPPVFHLPPHRVAHTRHAMPMNIIARNYKPSQAERKAGKFQGDPSIVFDTFVSVARCDLLFIGWPNVELSADDHSVLAKLLANMSSLGRAEGWVHAELTNEHPFWNCVPAPETDPNPVPVFCPDPATAFGNEHYPTVDPKKLAKGKVNPCDFLFDCPHWHLCLDTETIHGARWPTIPGAKWVNFTRPNESNCILAKSTPSERSKPTVARFLLDGPVLPLVTETIRVAEAFRDAAMSRFESYCRNQPPTDVGHFRRNDRPDRFVSPVFSGKDSSGLYLAGHDHAYYLPTADNDPIRLDHLTVYAAHGFDCHAVAALNAVRQLAWENHNPLRVQLVGLGRPDDFRCSLFGPSRVWESTTPFVVTRHVKKRGQKKDSLDCHGLSGRLQFAARVFGEECQRWLGRQLIVADAAAPAYNLLEHMGRNCPFRPLQFLRGRRKLGDDGANRATAAFRLEFDCEVAGPLCLGHASHFGLGLFLPAQ
jgi:CRISPR-associated protein Csb2